MLGRLPFVLLLATALVVAVLYVLNVPIPISEDEAIHRELRQHATTAELDRRVSDALARQDVDDAVMYADIATYMDRTLPPATQARLAAALSTGATVVRNAAGFATGFVTGEGASIAELAGAVTSDITVVGDVRDIVHEGGNYLAGKNYNELVLGLSVLGVAATGATIATGGGGVVARLGVSILKVAGRAGTLTADFARVLLRLVRDAVNTPELDRVLKTANLRDATATEAAITAYARGLKQAQIFPVLERLGEIGRGAGPGESVRLLKYVRNTEDLDNIAVMSTRLGKKTRGIIELTGRTSLRAFKTTLNIVQFLVERIVAFGAWLLSLLGSAIGRRLVRAGVARVRA